MKLLGINEGLNSSVAVLEDGRVVFAVQEERLNRIKEYAGFPEKALAFTLEYLDLAPSDFDAVCLSNLSSPTQSRAYFLDGYDINARSVLEHLADGNIRSASIKTWRGLPKAVRALRSRWKHKSGNADVEAKLAAMGFSPDKIRRTHHHENHAACAYFGMRQDTEEPHLVLTLDGGGDDACSHVYVAQGGKMGLIAETPIGHSLGQIFSRVTHLLGMRPHEHEYKLMGMAPYAGDEYTAPVADFLKGLLGLDPRNPMAFRTKAGDTSLIEPKLRKGLSGQRFDSISGGVQRFCEDLLIDWVRACVRETGISKVVAAGGVFMNVKANKRIAELPEVEFFDVFPSCGDETLCFGAAWLEYVRHDAGNHGNVVFDDFCLGPDATFDLDKAKEEYADRFEFETGGNLTQRVAQLLVDGEIVARACGRMEFGARALGNRSILADPGQPGIVPRINKIIKMRDFWMPFAPSILRDRAADYLVCPTTLPERTISPWMMHSFESTDQRDEMLATTHPYDGTARAQIVCEEINKGYHDIISAFAAKTGMGVLLNTSYNLHGFPIVLGARDALDVSTKSDIRFVLLPDCLASKRTGEAAEGE